MGLGFGVLFDGVAEGLGFAVLFDGVAVGFGLTVVFVVVLGLGLLLGDDPVELMV